MKDSEVGTAVAQFFGWLLMGVGGLIAFTAGACSLLVLLSSLSYLDGLPSTLIMIAGFGGIPILVGVAVFVAGRYLARRGRSHQRPPRRLPSEDDGSGL